MTKLFYSLITGALLFSSCKKSFLNQVPSTAVPVASSIKTANDLTDAVNGLYAAAKSYQLFGRDIPVLGDLLADNDYISSSNYGRYRTENAYTYINNSGEANDIWVQGYYTILQANRIIATPIDTNSTVNQLKGEAYTLRGLTYLALVNFFAAPYTVNPAAPGVPIVTVPTYVTGPLVKPARSTVTEVYQRILTDLDSAFALRHPLSTRSLHSFIHSGDRAPITTTRHHRLPRFVTSYNVPVELCP